MLRSSCFWPLCNIALPRSLWRDVEQAAKVQATPQDVVTDSMEKVREFPLQVVQEALDASDLLPLLQKDSGVCS